MSFFTKVELHDPPLDAEASRARDVGKALIDDLTRTIRQREADTMRRHAAFIAAMKDAFEALTDRDAALHELWTAQDALRATGATVPPPLTLDIPIVTNRFDPTATSRELYPFLYK